MAPSKKRKARIGRPPLKRGSKKSEGIGIRVLPDLRAALEKSAQSSGRSLSAEIAARLQGSLHFDAVRGEELREIANDMAAHFSFAGSATAKSTMSADASPSDWLKNRDCYDSAMQAVFLALWRNRPNSTQESTVDFFERLKARIVRGWWQQQTSGAGFVDVTKGVKP